MTACSEGLGSQINRFHLDFHWKKEQVVQTQVTGPDAPVESNLKPTLASQDLNFH
jgi:hypothetical protein